MRLRTPSFNSRLVGGITPGTPEYVAPGHEATAYWNDLTLVVEEFPNRYGASVLDSTGDIVFRTECTSLNAAKFVAVEFAIARYEGPRCDWKPEAVMYSLPWIEDRRDAYYLPAPHIRSK